MEVSKCLILVVAFIVGANAFGSGGSDRLFTKYMTSLKHGDNCSWELEEKRQNWTASLVSTSSVYLKLRYLRNWKRTVLSRRENFCSALSLLVCSKETNKCVCGDPGKQSMGLTDYPSDYTQEVGSKNQIKCRWSDEGACVVNDTPTVAEIEKQMDSKCASGTTCKTKAGDSECSLMAVVIHALINNIRSERQLTTDIFNGEICTCQINTTPAPTPALNPFFDADPNENEVEAIESNRFRQKRSVGNGRDFGNLHAFGVPYGAVLDALNS